MKPSTVFISLTLCIALAATSSAHESGEEYTYLNMFLTPEVPNDVISTESLETKPVVSVHNAQRRGSGRRLHSSGSESEDEREARNPSSVRESSRKISQTKKARNRRWRSARISVDTVDGDELQEIDFATRSYQKQQSEALSKARKGGTALNTGDKTNSFSLRTRNPAKATTRFEGVGGTKDGDDIKRVSFMLLKLLKQYKATSMVDVPCRAHASWMYKLLERIENEIPDFKYYCVDPSQEILDAVKSRVRNRTRAKYLMRRFWKEKLPKADFVFSWSGLDKMKDENVVNFLHNVATSEAHEYIILGSYMKGSEVVRKNARPINFRTGPYFLEQPLRVISKLSIAPVQKQMYLYRVDDLRESLQK